MAHEIEYVYVEHDRGVYDGFHRPPTWRSTLEQPDDIDKTVFIRLDNIYETELVEDMTEDQATRRWKLLAPGMPQPDDMDVVTAILYAEAIWIDTLNHYVTGHPYAITSFFRQCIADGADRGEYLIDRGRPRLDWFTFSELGHEAGVEFRIQAWLDGVQLDYLLAE